MMKWSDQSIDGYGQSCTANYTPTAEQSFLQTPQREFPISGVFGPRILAF